MRLWLRGPLQAKAAKAQGTAGSVGERKTGRAPLRPRCLGRPMGTLSGSAGATLPPFPPHLCCRTTQGGLAACFEGETPLRRDTSPSGPAASAGFRWPPGSQRRREDQSAGLDAGGGGGGAVPETKEPADHAASPPGRRKRYAARSQAEAGDSLLTRRRPALPAARSRGPAPDPAHPQEAGPGPRSRPPGAVPRPPLPSRTPAPSLPSEPRHSLTAEGSDVDPPGGQRAPGMWRGER